MGRLTPSVEVLAAFGLSGEPSRLAGGEGVVWRVDGVAVKPVIDAAEAEWTQALLSRIEEDGFRIGSPVAAADGAWVHDGWMATSFVPNLRPAAPDWSRICAAGLTFCDAAERVRDASGEILSARRHRWAVADRVAWDEQDVVLREDARSVVEEAMSHVARAVTGEHFVHADLSGNVFLDESHTPVILDVSPCLRPREWATAIVVADAVLWEGADVRLAREYVTDQVARDLFARALVFRLVAEQLADNPRHAALLRPYRRVLAALGG